MATADAGRLHVLGFWEVNVPWNDESPHSDMLCSDGMMQLKMVQKAESQNGFNETPVENPAEHSVGTDSSAKCLLP